MAKCRCGEEARDGQLTCKICHRDYMREYMRKKRGTVKTETIESREAEKIIEKAVIEVVGKKILPRLPVTFGSR